ncbi:zinc transporter ZntB [Pseudomonas resinovorans]|uniref:Zinc transporter ZntB n=1 Tax=Metapseudomonas resinovorans TaxID=53412 RepID=A0ABT4YAM5_METRE|nr:zinc transporter ZntB [Pseudomonas resinovorans]MDA8485932.1 zinc transporter ZntB [Pseudomonas resinovorans]
MFEEQNAQWGLVHAFVLDGQGGAEPISREALADLQLRPEQSVWLHWDRSHPLARRWLREQSGLSEFACDLLLEESTRPRMLAQPGDELLLFLRGVNLNPGAVPEDMVSVRIFASSQRILSLRLRPLHATDELIEQWASGNGPKVASEVLLYMAEHLTDKVDSLVAELSEKIDEQEEHLDNNERFRPDHDLMLQIRRRAAGLKRFLAPQRDIYGQLARSRMPWFVEDDSDYWNELNNRLTRYLEELELIRERIGLVLESESRRQGERTSRTMYLLGITTGFFLPLSFITGLLGMNVGGIPGDETPYGFILACVLILGIAGFQLWLFRRLRWL